MLEPGLEPRWSDSWECALSCCFVEGEEKGKRDGVTPWDWDGVYAADWRGCPQALGHIPGWVLAWAEEEG